MLWLLLPLLQVTPPAEAQPAPPSVPIPAAPSQPETPASQPAQPAQPAPPPGWGYPPPYNYGPYPYGQPYPYGYPPGYPMPPRRVEPTLPQPPEPPTKWLARISLAVGSGSFISSELTALRALGYSPFKITGILDAAYFFNQNVGIGAFGVYTTGNDDGVIGRLSEQAWFAGGQLPLFFGARRFGVLLSPRVGFVTGEISFSDDVDNQQGLALGADVAIVSFAAHLGASLGLLYGGVGAPGGVGRSHDFGSFYFSIGATLDG